MTGLVLVTGANGFVGQGVVAALARRGYSVRCATRKGPDCAVGDLGADTDWTPAVHGVKAVVHLAGRAHILREDAKDPLAAFRSVNVDATKRLAEAAGRSGVRRLVFISSVGVHGRISGDSPFTEESPMAPHNAYAQSKLEAEQGLRRVADGSGLETVVVRPPLIYGPGVKANFLALLRLVRSGIPLPLGGLENRRSLLALDNLADLVVRCIEAPEAAGESFLASDNEDLSTAELVRRIADKMNRPARLLPRPPVALVRLASRLTGRAAALDGLFGSLQVDAAKAQRVLRWQPPVSMDTALGETVEWYTARTRIAKDAEPDADAPR